MKTVSDHVREWADSLQILVDSLLEHSAIEGRDLGNENSSVVIITGSPNKWTELGEPGRHVQANALEEYRNFHALLRTLLSGQPEGTLRELREAHDEVLEVIEQPGATHLSRPGDAFSKAKAAIETQVGLLHRLFDGSSGKITLVPDTNALLHNPSLDAWRFDGARRFVLLLLPTVLRELDKLKVEHRNDEVRKKAERLIRQVKDYRGRGRLSEGVTLARDVSEIASIAVEPRMDRSLPWLDPANEDDRLLAGVIEVMRQRPRSPVVLVTRDVNLMNKADFARVPVAEPPDPT